MKISASSLSRTAFTNGRGLSWPALVVIASGALIAVGSTMPWFSLFAGLQPYRGTSGLYGQVVLGSGVVAMIAGTLLLRRDTPVVNNALIASGIVLSGFMAWLVSGLLETYQKLLENPMYVARLEPGLFLAMAGALTITLVAAYTRLRNPGLQRATRR